MNKKQAVYVMALVAIGIILLTEFMALCYGKSFIHSLINVAIAFCCAVAIVGGLFLVAMIYDYLE